MNRFILQPSEQEGYFVCTDTENGIVCKFKAKAFNDEQSYTLLDDIEPNPSVIAQAMNDMNEWLYNNHYLEILPMPNIRVWVGFRIKQLREKRGLTQQQLSDISGVARPNIANIEAGKYDIRLDTVEKLCHALNVDIDFREGQ